MTLDDAIESFCGFLNILSPGENAASRYSYFYVGEEKDIDSALDTLREDIEDDLLESIPMPFSDLVLIVRCGEDYSSWSENDEIGQGYLKLREMGFDSEMWSFTCINSIPSSPREVIVSDFCYLCGAKRWFIGFVGRAKVVGKEFGGIKIAYQPLVIKKEYEKHLTTDSLNPRSAHASIWHLGLVSHPGNYVIRESPILTQKELARCGKGVSFPNRKRPRYIIVDHNVLVGKMDCGGTHASPVPHQRRGHWMRLAEHCVHARARGLQKTWVRPCYVGETDFVRNGRRYQVLLDFNARQVSVS